MSLFEIALALIVALLVIILVLVATQKGTIVRRMSGELERCIRDRRYVCRQGKRIRRPRK